MIHPKANEEKVHPSGVHLLFVAKFWQILNVHAQVDLGVQRWEEGGREWKGRGLIGWGSFVSSLTGSAAAGACWRELESEDESGVELESGDLLSRRGQRRRFGRDTSGVPVGLRERTADESRGSTFGD
ncbi:hypothetical protein AXG93_2528s1890 [Marchantia polymorpha subsp. ruderalis]|uniref:Uncharacterized protein n=1 Tax=Marchantia polymorpha subsp. ruderalis TaxID=1480154 RepID=A0A176WRA0_MARPO|nr:hypothetical protein AXG93_2528s1890 [Marchantia polymorpha subsp. ruderalis]